MVDTTHGELQSHPIIGTRLRLSLEFYSCNKTMQSQRTMIEEIKTDGFFLNIL